MHGGWMRRLRRTWLVWGFETGWVGILKMYMRHVVIGSCFCDGVVGAVREPPLQFDETKECENL